MVKAVLNRSIRGRAALLVMVCIFIMLTGCRSKYSLSGDNLPKDVKTFEVKLFENNADIVEPGLARNFTNKLQDQIKDKSKLILTNTVGDLVYEGEIVEYRVTPMTATANQRASQNRLTIAVMVRFTNKKKEDDNFEKRFSFYYDYSGDDLPRGQILSDALEAIFERIIQDIFNESLAKW